MSKPFEYPDRFMREPERRRVTGLGPVQWAREEEKGTAPRRIPLTDLAVGWLESEIVAWMRERAANPDTPERRAARRPPYVRQREEEGADRGPA